jgi:predicted metal-binding protein
MKAIEELVKEYVFNVLYLEGVEAGNIESNLGAMLEFQERQNNNILLLEEAITNKYNIEFNGTCYSKGQEKLSELCDIEFSKMSKYS